MAAAIGGAIVGAVATGLVNKALSPSSKGGMTAADHAAAGLTNEQAAMAREQRELWSGGYRPLEESMIAEAEGFGSPEEQAREAAEAGADVAMGFAGARRTMADSASRRYVRTDSPAYIQALAGLQLGEAKASAFGQNTARKRVRDDAFTKRMNVINVGRGHAAAATQGLGAASAAMSNASESSFFRGQYLQEQARRGLAPVAGAIGDQVAQSTQQWIANRNPQYITAPGVSQPTYPQ